MAVGYQKDFNFHCIITMSNTNQIAIETTNICPAHCVLCQEKYFKVISRKVRDSINYKVVKCQNCGLLQLSPMPSVEDNKYFYDRNLQARNIKAPSNLKIIRQNSLNDTKRRTRMVSRHIKKNQTLLDIGSGYGFFLQEMDNLGYKITGIETSRERQKASAKITKAKVLDVNLLESDSASSKFDCITLFHVLEHINNPVLFLKIIKKHLNNNGKLIIEVPNSDDMLLETCEKYRDFYWQKAHLFYFNVKTLKKIVQKAGFSIINTSYVQRYGIENFINWLVLGKPQIRKPVFQTNSIYKWLEDYYKKYLSKVAKSDTLILITKPKIK